MNRTPIKVNKQRTVSSMAATEVRSEPTIITPELARRWLGQNSASQRNLSDYTVQGYASEMRAGRWRLTHQGVAFNQAGELVDGQHRLNAIVVADVPVKMMVTTGLAIEYNSPIDLGYQRRVDQIMGKHTRWVGTVRCLIFMEREFGSGGKPQIGEIEVVGERHKEALNAVLAVAKQKKITVGVVASAVWAYPLHPNKVLSFMREVDTGELLTKGDPALTLRNWLSSESRGTKETIYATCNAVRYALEGNKLYHLYGNTSTDSTRTGETGYHWLNQKRRVMRLPGTPAYSGPSKPGQGTREAEGPEVVVLPTRRREPR